MSLAQQYPTISSRAVIGMFYEELEKASGFTDTLAMRFTSNQPSETYAGLTNTPMIREWIGGKDLKKPDERSLVVTNKDWESTMQFSNKDLRRDKTDQIRLRIGQLAQRVPQHIDKLISLLIDNGTATTYGTFADGLSFFNDAHVYGASTNDNKISVTIANLPTGGTGTHGTTTSPSGGEMSLSILEAIKQLYGFVDSAGEPINQSARQFVVMVPVGHYTAAMQAVSLSSFAYGLNNNPLTASGLTVKVMMNPRLTSTTKFYVFRTDSMLKPFIYQVEVEPIVKMLAEGSDYEFINGAQLFSVEWAGNIGYGLPDQAVEVTLA